MRYASTFPVVVTFPAVKPPFTVAPFSITALSAVIVPSISAFPAVKLVVVVLSAVKLDVFTLSAVTVLLSNPRPPIAPSSAVI